ncbi:DNA polymerase kappa isoform X1 [Pangasianodon hypophthalmus]|uniref:DNA polymerase kappa isoform X1 n=1 Tax=Pangasianodon hypophthalmus TaxID=310915 RepID=UPI0023078B2A|nr:DNA polymerase kappa isoform X1 [Pangasianodon hypophthalmus]XP_026786849.3 DNA polymerase kappa isoform X1 [Pangasianodon hypophthalmus]
MEPGCSTGQDSILSRVALNDNKAGMQGLDKDKINKIILETTKGSRFYESELKKERQLNQRVEKMMRYKAKVTEQQIQKAQAEVEKLAADLERSRKLERVIVHVDMDAFYAAVEMRDCPELKNKPMAVGSMSMLSTSNYHARRYGVRAAMPGFIAKKLCPNLVIVPLNFDKYRAVSEQVREVFADYDPHFLPMSLDEACLDITEHLEQRQHWPESMRTYQICEVKTTADVNELQTTVGAETDTLSPVLFEDSPGSSPTVPGADGKVEVFGTTPEEAVREMRFRIEQKTTLTASAGIAPNMMLAKVCSDKNKPNGQYRILPERKAVMDFIQELPVRKISGIGKVTEKMLAALGIITCSQLGQQMAMLSLLFSETTWHHFLQISLGLGSTHIDRDSERKSMSTERTFAEMSNADEQYSLCRELCHDLAKDLQREGLKGKTVTLKLKNVNFEVKTKAFSLQCAVCTEEEIFAAAKDLLKAEIDNVSPLPLRLRLMGVRVSSFISVDDKQPQQKSIVGFLKIASDCSSSAQPSKSEMVSVLGSSVSLTREQCPETRSASFTGETSKPFSKWRTESGCTAEPQQQTFFQKAHAKRLQKQYEQEETSDKIFKCLPADSTNNSAFIVTTHKPTVKTEETQTCTWKRHPDTDDTAAKADSSLSTTNKVSYASQTKTQSANMLQCFTCPVCFNQIETKNLSSFNQHIDECLSGELDNKRTSMDGCQDVCQEEKLLGKQDEAKKEHIHHKVTDLNSGSRTSILKRNNERPYTSSSTPLFENSAHSDFRTPFFKRFKSTSEKSSFVPHEAMSDSGSVSFQQTASSVEVISEPLHKMVPILTCPVCSQAQDTDDLILFNHHVDMCLNQEVLLEFREAVPPMAQSDSKVKDLEKLSTARGKSKRRGSSPPPPPKKTKAISTRHTIDKFFKGNCNQKF